MPSRLTIFKIDGVLLSLKALRAFILDCDGESLEHEREVRFSAFAYRVVSSLNMPRSLP
jgi:hypothetical protein